MNSKLKKVLAGVLLAVMSATCVLAGCNCGGTKESKLVVAYSNFSEKFSPFFATSAYDVDVYSMTQVGLVATERTGNIVYKGIEGETIKYNGTDYTYYGISDLVVTQNDDGTVDYKITMRKDIKFSDGTPMTVKDAVFSMYVYSDTDYDGSTTFYTLPIIGMSEWRTNLRTDILEKYTKASDAILATYDEDEGGYVYAESEDYTQEQFDSLTAAINADANYVDLANDIIAYVADNYAKYTGADSGYSRPAGIDLTKEGEKIAFAMRMWGFGSFDTDYAEDEDGTYGKIGDTYKQLYVITEDEEKAKFQDADGNMYKKVESKDDADAVYIVGKNADGETYQVHAYVDENDEQDVRYAEVPGNSFTDSNDNHYDLVTKFPTVQDYADCIKEAYGGDATNAINTETAGGVSVDNIVQKWIAEQGKTEMAGENIKSISGITFDEEKYEINVKTSEYAATTVYQLTIAVAPMHYYGDTAKWDPENGSYGFTRGNLNGVRSKTTKPMGAGPYKFVSYSGGVVTFVANENYWQGEPKIKNLMFKEYSKDEDKTPAVISGEVDIATPSINDDVVKLIKKTNGSEELAVKDTLTIATDLVDYNGYGYIGINSENVKVGTEKASDESKYLRKALATLFAAYREYTVNSYYHERASVIEYPITNCSWAAPQPADEGYTTAFSKDVDGNDIYTADMNEEQRYAAAKTAMIGFLKAAGYTWDEETGKFIACPEGAKMEYEAIIGGGGTGDHPTFALLNKAAEVLKEVGIELTVNDMSSSDTLFKKMEAGTAEIFVAAWGGSSDPDMYQVYHSENAVEGKSNHYRIQDAELDELIVNARKSADTSYRKAAYKQCLDIILDWAVEIPVYQRKDCTVYNSNAVKISSITPDTTPYWSYLMEIHTLEMK